MTDKALWGTPSYALVGAWLVGATTLCFVFILAELRFRRLVKCGLVGPAVVGVAYPRLVVPHDFAERFTVQEQAFIRRHERAHMVRHDTLINLLIASAQVFGWFNPLIHLAARQIRLDQELACDAQALAGRPTDRRAYGETLVREHLAGRTTSSNLGCAWTPLGRHPLETRLANLIQIEPDLRQGVCGAVAIATLCVAISITVWSLAPSSRQNLAAAAPIATASADIQN